MKIVEHEDSKVKLKLPSFSCDGQLGKHIPEPIPNQAFAWLFSGKAGSGKTSLAMSLLCAKGDARVYRGIFDHVHIVAPQASLASMKNDYFKGHHSSRMHHELDWGVLEEIIEDAIKVREEDDGNTLLLIDDMASSLKNKDVQKQLMRAIANRRHYGLSLMILAQSYMFVPLSVRKQLTHLSMWKPTNRKEFESVFQELIYLDKDSAEELSKHVYQEKYDHLFLDINRSKFYRNFNSLELSDE